MAGTAESAATYEPSAARVEGRRWDGTPYSELSALENTIDLEQTSIMFDPPAAVLLCRIREHGHATCEDLASWLETPEEWIAFSRLQRARLLYDAGTEFTVSREGHALLDELLSEAEEE